MRGNMTGMPRIVNGRYRLLEDKGKLGGFSEVFKAYDLDVDPPEAVAIKLLRVGVHSDVIANTSVAREFGSLERLQHKNIVSLIEADIDRETGRKFIAL